MAAYPDVHKGSFLLKSQTKKFGKHFKFKSPKIKVRDTWHSNTCISDTSKSEKHDLIPKCMKI